MTSTLTAPGRGARRWDRAAVVLVCLLSGCAASARGSEPAPAQPAAEIDPSDVAFHARINARLEARRRFVFLTSPERYLPGGVSHPVPEPAYDGRRSLDFSPFQAVLDQLDPGRVTDLEQILRKRDIPSMQDLMTTRRLSSEELVTWYLDRIRRHDVEQLNAVLSLNPDVLERARERDRERLGGKTRGPLHGIPVLLKDNIATGDRMPTTAGAWALKDWRARRDAFLVQKLRQAGAVVLGKANLTEWANYTDPTMPNGFSTLGGQTRSPYGPFDPSGSSTGSAVAVAAHFATVSVGTETSGSIIQPARFNSLVALRPSRGLVSRDRVIPLSQSLDTPGPMGRTVTDVALLLNAMAGVDERDPETARAADLAGENFARFLSLEEARKFRVGVFLFDEQAEARLEQLRLMLRWTGREKMAGKSDAALLAEHVLPELGGDPRLAIEALRSQGIDVVEIPDASLPPFQDTVSGLLSYDFRQSVARFFSGLTDPPPVHGLSHVVAINRKDPANRAPYGHRLLEWAAIDGMSDEEFQRYRMVGEQMAEAWMNRILDRHEVDVLVSGMSYTLNAGAAGVPAMTVPAGLDPRGRPQGVILTGPHGSEPRLFAVAWALEQALRGRVEPALDAAAKATRKSRQPGGSGAVPPQESSAPGGRK